MPAIGRLGAALGPRHVKVDLIILRGRRRARRATSTSGDDRRDITVRLRAAADPEGMGLVLIRYYVESHRPCTRIGNTSDHLFEFDLSSV